MPATLERAIAIAHEAHRGQTRFDGSPYIEHPLFVMNLMKLFGHSETTQIVAVLHDVPEDSKWTCDDLRREGYEDDVIYPLELLTKEKGMDYDWYIRRLVVNPRSRVVKKGDLFHNLNLDGLQNPSARRIENIDKYARALGFLARFPQPRV